MTEDGFLEVGGARLEFSRWPGSTPTLVLLHEGLGSVSMWRGFPLALAEASGHAVLAYSRAGYGRSSAASLPRPLSYMHDEALLSLREVLRQAGGDAILVGHSDGASIAAIHAGAAPAPALRGVVMMAPHFFVEDVAISSIAAAKAAYETGDLRARLARHHGDVDGAFRGWNDAWLDPAFRAWDIRGYLPGIAVPVLAIQGEDDEYGTLAQIETARELVRSRFEAVVLDACGHSPHRDRPEETAAAIARFVKALSDAPQLL